MAMTALSAMESASIDSMLMSEERSVVDELERLEAAIEGSSEAEDLQRRVFVCLLNNLQNKFTQLQPDR